jgi:3-hydroxyacyl-[acyl-carrier-protein] dehydratase
LFDLDQYDLTQVVLTREQVYAVLPQRHEFMLLDGVILLDTRAERIIAYADVCRDAWWARGHIPARALLPGVLMIEMAAQAATYYTRALVGHAGFLAFTALDNCKFRGTVEPPCRLYLLGMGIDIRPRRSICAFQGLVDGKMVFEAQLTGIPI